MFRFPLNASNFGVSAACLLEKNLEQQLKLRPRYSLESITDSDTLTLLQIQQLLKEMGGEFLQVNFTRHLIALVRFFLSNQKFHVVDGIVHF